MEIIIENEVSNMYDFSNASSDSCSCVWDSWGCSCYGDCENCQDCCDN